MTVEMEWFRVKTLPEEEMDTEFLLKHMTKQV